MKNRDPCKAMVRQFLLYLFMNSTHFPWPLRVRLKQPSLKFVISIKHMIRVILKWLKGRGMSVPVPRERVSPTLKHNCGGLVQLHHSGGKQASAATNWWSKVPGHNGDKKALVGCVVNPVSQREVQAVVLASASPNISKNRTCYSYYSMILIMVFFSHHGDIELSHLRSPVPGKYSPYLWKDTVMTRSVV